MSHTIKLEDRVYEKLQKFQGKRETYSQAVERLLAAKEKVNELIDILVGRPNSQGGNHDH
ncbi:hypothetical protein ES703_56496 [subsurface metagenome]